MNLFFSKNHQNYAYSLVINPMAEKLHQWTRSLSRKKHHFRKVPSFSHQFLSIFPYVSHHFPIIFPWEVGNSLVFPKKWWEVSKIVWNFPVIFKKKLESFPPKKAVPKKTGGTAPAPPWPWSSQRVKSPGAVPCCHGSRPWTHASARPEDLGFDGFFKDLMDMFIEGSLEVKLPTIWTDEKQSREEAERRERSEERRCRCAKR